MQKSKNLIIQSPLFTIKNRGECHLQKEHLGVEIHVTGWLYTQHIQGLVPRGLYFYLTNSALLNKRVLSQNKTLIN